MSSYTGSEIVWLTGSCCTSVFAAPEKWGRLCKCWTLHDCDNFDIFTPGKIIFQEYTRKICYLLDEAEIWFWPTKQRYFFNFCMMELMNFVLIFLNHWATDMFLQGWAGPTGFDILISLVKFSLLQHKWVAFPVYQSFWTTVFRVGSPGSVGKSSSFIR